MTHTGPWVSRAPSERLLAAAAELERVLEAGAWPSGVKLEPEERLAIALAAEELRDELRRRIRALD